MAAEGAHLWLDTSSVNAAIVETYKAACDKYLMNRGSRGKTKNKQYFESGSLPVGPSGVYMRCPVSLAKALKNPSELEGMQNSHLRYLISPCNSNKNGLQAFVDTLLL